MKNVELDINKNDLPADIEKSTEYDIDISEYNMDNAALEYPEDLTEKVIGYIEKEVRGSFEYRKYINYMKTELDLTKCALLPGIDCSEGAASLEFHHYPMNLYEITETIGNQMLETLAEDEKLSCFDIAERVMEEHYRGNIGLIPLTKTLHDMAHNKSIIIPISKVNGDYKKFMKKYSSNISEDIKDRIKDAELNSESDESKLFNETKLEKNITTFNITYYNFDDEDAEGGTDEEE